MVPMLGSALLDGGVRPDITLAGYDQIFQTCFDHRRQFGSNPDVIVLLWRIEDLLALEFTRFIGGDSTALADACRRVDELGQAVSHLRRSFNGTIIASLPPFPDATPADLLDLDAPLSSCYFCRAVVAHATQRLTEAGNVRLIDLNALQQWFGARNAFDGRTWYLYRQPYSEAFLCEIGGMLGRIIKATRTAAKKCIVLDCDNTLWAGVVGEDGVRGIAVGEEFPGSAFRDLQHYLLHLRAEGVLLAIASKNNEADVWEVFERHDGMVLKREHISAARINWQPKAVNLKDIAEELNIGVDSLVFVDDNLFEIEQMRTFLPEVTSILLDEEPARMVNAIKELHLFDKLELTQEDFQRADMMRSEQQRAQLSKTLSAEDFIASLELRIEIVEARPDQLGRIAQLTNKTNQFNLTTVRRSLEQIEAIKFFCGLACLQHAGGGQIRRLRARRRRHLGNRGPRSLADRYVPHELSRTGPRRRNRLPGAHRRGGAQGRGVDCRCVLFADAKERACLRFLGRARLPRCGRDCVDNQRRRYDRHKAARRGQGSAS